MTRYLLDTDALIDFSKGKEPATSLILSWIDGSDVVSVCAVTVAEFFSGISAARAAPWWDFVLSLAYADITAEAAMHAGQDRYRYARSGHVLTTTDALLAAVTRDSDATLVTGNIKHYPMEGLSLLSIR